MSSTTSPGICEVFLRRHCDEEGGHPGGRHRVHRQLVRLLRNGALALENRRNESLEMQINEQVN